MSNYCSNSNFCAKSTVALCDQLHHLHLLQL